VSLWLVWFNSFFGFNFSKNHICMILL